MFRKLSAVTLVLLGSITIATAQESKEAGGKKQITNSIGMKLTPIPSGDFLMGSGESAEATAAFFHNTYGLDSQCGRLQRRASTAPGSHYQAVLPWYAPCHAGPVSPVRQRFGI